MSVSAKQHKRALTYEGPQMNFKFPSEEDLDRISEESQSEVVLEGPKVQPYFEYEQTHQQFHITNPDSSQMADKRPLSITYQRPESANFFSHNNTQSLSPSLQSYSCASGSLPSASNVTYQISEKSKTYHIPQVPVGSREPSMKRTQIINKPKTLSRTSTLKRRTSIKRNNTVTRSRSIRNEENSLYRNASLKRSKAVKYKVGWLTRLKNMGINLKTKFKSWRFISVKKAFRFTRRNNSKSRKSKISMPLERGRAQSISELRMATEDFGNTPFNNQHNNNNSLGLAPNASKYKLNPTTTSTESITPTFTRVPPPPPPHRIASNPSMQKYLQDQQRVVSSTTQGSCLRSPLDEKFPSQPNVVYDDTDLALEQDEGSEEEDDDDVFDEEYQEAKIREYWSHYLRKVVAQRIESKLEFHALSQIPEPETPNTYNSESSFEHISDAESDHDDSGSEFEKADDESLTSVSGSEFSTDLSNINSYTSTNYYSSYDGPVATPAEIIQYQHNFMSRYRDINVKRSSTLPINSQATINSRHNTFQVQPSNHLRFASVVQ